MRRTALGSLLVAASLTSIALAPVASAAVSHKNCTELQKTYKNGVGKAGARDKTTGTPVTTFTRDTAAYDRAMRANRSLDRDRDGIACEKR